MKDTFSFDLHFSFTIFLCTTHHSKQQMLSGTALITGALRQAARRTSIGRIGRAAASQNHHHRRSQYISTTPIGKCVDSGGYDRTPHIYLLSTSFFALALFCIFCPYSMPWWQGYHKCQEVGEVGRCSLCSLAHTKMVKDHG